VQDTALSAYRKAVLGRLAARHVAAGDLLPRLAGGGGAKYEWRAAAVLAMRGEVTAAVERALQAAALDEGGGGVDGAAGGGEGAVGDLPRGDPPRPPPHAAAAGAWHLLGEMVSSSAAPALRRALEARRLLDAALARPTPAAVAVVGALAGSLPPALRPRLTAGCAARLAGLTLPLLATHPTATALAALDWGRGERLAATAECALAACSVAASATAAAL